MGNDISDSLKAGGGNLSESFPGEAQRQTAGLLQPRYQATFSPENQIIITIDDLFFGSIFDSRHFKESERLFGGYLKDYEKEILRKLEYSIQTDYAHKGQRRHSGLPSYYHIYRDIEEAIKISIKAKAPLDFIIFMTLLAHDKIEDDEGIKELNDKWSDALFRGDEAYLINYAKSLMDERLRKSDILEKEIAGYMPFSVRGNDREVMRSRIEKGVRLVLDVTRFTEQNPYAISLRHHYTKFKNEGLDQTLRRIIAKNADKISNALEMDPLSAELMEQLRMASNDQRVVSGFVNGREVTYTIGEVFRDRFGSILSYGKPMPAVMRVANAVNAVTGLQYANTTFNKYGRHIGSGKYNANISNLFNLARVSRDAMADATLAQVLSAISLYEEDNNLKDLKPEIKQAIKAKLITTFYDRITWGGFIGDWILADVGGRKNIERLDDDSVQRQKSYEDAHHTAVLVPRFKTFYDPSIKEKRQLLEDPNLYEPTKHLYFALGGYRELMRLLPDYHEAIIEKRRRRIRA